MPMSFPFMVNHEEWNGPRLQDHDVQVMTRSLKATALLASMEQWHDAKAAISVTNT